MAAMIDIYKYWCIEAKTSLEYAVYVPASMQQGGGGLTAPLVVALHDKGSSPAEVMGLPGLVDHAKQISDHCIVVAPLGYNEHGWYGCLGETYKDSSSPDSAPQFTGLLSEADVLNVVGIMRKTYSIDDTKIHVVGFGMGGSGALHLASKYPFLWASATAVSADVLAIQNVQPIDEVLQTMKEVPLMVMHGTADKVVSKNNVHNWVDRMKRNDLTYKYVELDGMEKVHSSGWFGFVEEAFAWMSKQRKMKGAKAVIRPSVYYEKPQKKSSFPATSAGKKGKGKFAGHTTNQLKSYSYGIPYENTSTSMPEPEPESAACWV